MAERPLLILPTAEYVAPPKLGGGGSKPFTPNRETQSGRIGPAFARLRDALNRAPDRVHELRADPTALAPDRVIVFEIAGTVADFAKAVAKVPGLELIVEYETAAEPDELFAVKDTRKDREGQRREDKMVEGRFYLAMPDVAASEQLLGLYDRWARGQELDEGFARSNTCSRSFAFCGRGDRRTVFPTRQSNTGAGKPGFTQTERSAQKWNSGSGARQSAGSKRAGNSERLSKTSEARSSTKH